VIIPSADKRALPPETDGRAEARSPGGFERNGCRDLTTKAVGGTNPSTTTYAYDSLNRLTSISGAVTASYRYNGDGLRVGKTFGTPSPSYVRGPTGSGWPLSGGTSAYVWGQGLISSIAGSGNGMTTYALKNALQNPILQLARSGSLTAAVTFDAFGNPTSQSGTPSAVGFTGGIMDSETGFFSLKARYYDPSSGRFITRDPLPGSSTDPATQNGFVYAKDNPTRYIDPFGKDDVPVDTVDQGNQSGQSGCDSGCDTSSADGSPGSNGGTDTQVTDPNNGNSQVIIGCFLGVCKVVGFVENGVRRYFDTLGYMSDQVNWKCQIIAALSGVAGLLVGAALTSETGPGAFAGAAAGGLLGYGIAYATCVST
jgi:RHS repeat-associated protein